jgi:hypothetical protein
MATQQLPNCSSGDACRTAALRAYRELRDRGLIDPDAFEAAVRVFQYHHPSMLRGDAKLVVADWIAPDA